MSQMVVKAAGKLEIRVWAVTLLLGAAILAAGYILWTKVGGY